MNDAQIKHMVSRFLGWKLPENFAPDAGISFKPTFNDHLPTPSRHDPSGTNLFDATQAEAMVRYMLEGLPASTAPASPVAILGEDASAEVRRMCFEAAQMLPKGYRVISDAEYSLLDTASPVVGEDAQTIDSAPKDKAILVYSFGWEKAHYNTAYEKWIGHGYDTSDTNLLNLHPPTHWRSLPPDPKEALSSIPTPTAGRAEALEEAAKICKAESLRWFAKSDAGSTLTYIMQCQSRAETAKECGNKIRALSSAPTPQAVTVDDARLTLKWNEALTLANNACIRRINELNADDGSMEAMTELEEAAKEIRGYLEPTLTAAFPQRREE